MPMDVEEVLRQLASKPSDDSSEILDCSKINRLKEIGALSETQKSKAFYDFIENLGDYHPALQARPNVQPFARLTGNASLKIPWTSNATNGSISSDEEEEEEAAVVANSQGSRANSFRRQISAPALTPENASQTNMTANPVSAGNITRFLPPIFSTPRHTPFGLRSSPTCPMPKETFTPISKSANITKIPIWAKNRLNSVVAAGESFKSPQAASSGAIAKTQIPMRTSRRDIESNDSVAGPPKRPLSKENISINVVVNNTNQPDAARLIADERVRQPLPAMNSPQIESATPRSSRVYADDQVTQTIAAKGTQETVPQLNSTQANASYSRKFTIDNRSRSFIVPPKLNEQATADKENKSTNDLSSSNNALQNTYNITDRDSRRFGGNRSISEHNQNSVNHIRHKREGTFTIRHATHSYTEITDDEDDVANMGVRATKNSIVPDAVLPRENVSIHTDPSALPLHIALADSVKEPLEQVNKDIETSPSFMSSSPTLRRCTVVLHRLCEEPTLTQTMSKENSRKSLAMGNSAFQVNKSYSEIQPPLEFCNNAELEDHTPTAVNKIRQSFNNIIASQRAAAEQPPAALSFKARKKKRNKLKQKSEVESLVEEIQKRQSQMHLQSLSQLQSQSLSQSQSSQRRGLYRKGSSVDRSLLTNEPNKTRTENVSTQDSSSSVRTTIGSTQNVDVSSEYYWSAEDADDERTYAPRNIPSEPIPSISKAQTKKTKSKPPKSRRKMLDNMGGPDNSEITGSLEATQSSTTKCNPITSAIPTRQSILKKQDMPENNSRITRLTIASENHTNVPTPRKQAVSISNPIVENDSEDILSMDGSMSRAGSTATVTSANDENVTGTSDTRSKMSKSRKQSVSVNNPTVENNSDVILPIEPSISSDREIVTTKPVKQSKKSKSKKQAIPTDNLRDEDTIEVVLSIPTSYTKNKKAITSNRSHQYDAISDETNDTQGIAGGRPKRTCAGKIFNRYKDYPELFQTMQLKLRANKSPKKSKNVKVPVTKRKTVNTERAGSNAPKPKKSKRLKTTSEEKSKYHEWLDYIRDPNQVMTESIGSEFPVEFYEIDGKKVVISSYWSLKFTHNNGIDVAFFPTFDNVSNTGVMRFLPNSEKRMSSNACQITFDMLYGKVQILHPDGENLDFIDGTITIMAGKEYAIQNNADCVSILQFYMDYNTEQHAISE